MTERLICDLPSPFRELAEKRSQEHPDYRNCDFPKKFVRGAFPWHMTPEENIDILFWENVARSPVLPWDSPAIKQALHGAPFAFC